MLTDRIVNNPYRILGVASQSPRKELACNVGKLRAFLRVGKTLSLPYDLTSLLGTLERTEERLSWAERAVELPNDRVGWGLFWFMRRSGVDDVALDRLSYGDVEAARELWQKVAESSCRNSALCSARQNLIVLALVRGDLGEVARLVSTLYREQPEELSTSLHEGVRLSSEMLLQRFLQGVAEAEPKALTGLYNASDAPQWWRDGVREQQLRPTIDSLEAVIVAAERERECDGDRALKAADILLEQGTPLLGKLRTRMGVKHLTYQRLADRTAQTLLLLAVQLLNGGDTHRRAQQAVDIIKKAQATAYGTMVKEECQKALDQLRILVIVSRD